MKIVLRAIELGVNYLDTSWPYHSEGLAGEGPSEPFVGMVLKEVGRDIYNANHIFDVPYISDKTYSLQIANSGMQADLCNNCGRCGGVCPQGINIPCELRKVARYFARA